MRPVNRGANGNQGSKWITKVKCLAIYLRDGFHCVWCWRDLHGAAPAEITLDHLSTRIGSTPHRETNLVTACRRCNSRRKDMPWREFAAACDIEYAAPQVSNWHGHTERRIRAIKRQPLARYLTLAKELIENNNERATEG